MAAQGPSVPGASRRRSGKPDGAERCCLSPAARATAKAHPSPEPEPEPETETELEIEPQTELEPETEPQTELDFETEPQLDLSLWLNADSDEERSDSRPLWEPVPRSAAAALLERCLAAGAVTQETLDLTRRETPCFVKFSEMEKMANMQAEINEIKLKTEMMQLEKETADITHLFYLGKKYEILQDMNSHLEAVLKEKRALRKKLIKPKCQESLPIDATFHKCIIELLTEAVTFTEKLESHLQSVRSIPQVPNMVKNMDTALTKTEVFVMELEELTKQILKWRQLQKEVYSDSLHNRVELDFGLYLT